MCVAGLEVSGSKINLADTGGHWFFDDLARTFHPTVDGPDAIEDILLASYTASPPSIAQVGSAAADPASCAHGADPENTCSAIADSTGCCQCNNDGTTYGIMTSGTHPCGWFRLPTQISCDYAIAATITRTTVSVSSSFLHALSFLCVLPCSTTFIYVAGHSLSPSAII